MASLRQAQVQANFRPLIIAFVFLTTLIFGGTIYAGWSKTSIIVTPKVTTIKSSLTLIIGPTAASDHQLVGTVTETIETKTVTAKPSATGASVDAHASGQVVLHNDGSPSQALASGTRLQTEDGVIVRTTSRTDVPAHGTVTVGAVADPLGVSGEIKPGRLTIVALRPANQLIIYGQVETAFTGGTTTAAGSLGIESLTKASDQAQAEMTKTFGTGQAGTLKALVPKEVLTSPAADVPSDHYDVTVTMTGLTVTYQADQVATLARQALQAELADDQELLSLSEPKLTLENRPSSTAIEVTVAITGQAGLKASSTSLKPDAFVGLDRQAIITKLTGTKLVESVTVKFSPWWRQRAPSQAGSITVTLKSSAS